MAATILGKRPREDDLELQQGLQQRQHLLLGEPDRDQQIVHGVGAKPVHEARPVVTPWTELPERLSVNHNSRSVKYGWRWDDPLLQGQADVARWPYVFGRLDEVMSLLRPYDVMGRWGAPNGMWDFTDCFLTPSQTVFMEECNADGGITKAIDVIADNNPKEHPLFKAFVSYQGHRAKPEHLEVLNERLGTEGYLLPRGTVLLHGYEGKRELFTGVKFNTELLSTTVHPNCAQEFASKNNDTILVLTIDSDDVHAMHSLWEREGPRYHLDLEFELLLEPGLTFTVNRNEYIWMDGQSTCRAASYNPPRLYRIVHVTVTKE